MPQTSTGIPGAAVDAPVRRPRLLIAGLSVVVLTVAVLQTAVVPVLGVIAEQLDASMVAVSWAVTANLLAAAAATPLIGRIADLYRKKRVLLGVLAVVLAGSVLAAATSSLALLIVARVLQAASFALYPICIAILREELPPERMVSAMAVLSGTLGFGGGTGLVVVGLLMNGDAGYHRVFWLTTVFTLLVIAIVVTLVPDRRRSASGSIDWLGAAGLAVGLTSVLLAITQADSWGWGSPRTVGSAGGGVAVLIAWWFWERRAARPLVSTRMLARRSMLFTNLATVFVGMGLYFAFLGLTQFVQIDRDTAGYGFGATVLEASVVYLLPGALAGFLIALVSGRFIDRFGARPVLVVAALAGIAGFLFIAFAHSAPWQVVTASILANAYISLGYGALPALVVGDSEPGETGVATSMNAIARTVGSSTAAAVVAVLIGRTTAAGAPSESSFTAIFLGGAVTAFLAMALIAVSHPRSAKSAEARLESQAMNHEWG
ncbi:MULTISPECIES: MFS transporter [Mycolicibacterium]|uniref:Major facilitator superfamily MFS_1 n=2 Tax=Mycolicibacterium TaxID=1866885 RepID=A1TAI2_MYCVP|nr:MULTISPECIES: MFS transporter [Mycolicibacterium]ABM14182.1 major facilitator superfamily MFS_1 [Mycolicibacterium vanbaalenii PYR-1]MCV7126752.1 MFS transporter [Mycolicibacterium vanbaalenii PYR-1]MDN4520261.1 MFS transporter [Mycolicibacterium austroafricanum]MDW5614726.1 MFS transporter [Mycolicibacterium sp. D5.8-2]QRZ04555.1 MFS transporter [Mycolicibacterium austroafricanum]